MQQLKYATFVFSVLLLTSLTLYGQEIINVTIQGISDARKDSKRQDRNEAIFDAKLKAIEKAGVSISAVTTVENYKLKRDWIESKANAVILPGFEIVDVGYGEDGLYHVVLVGKVQKQLNKKDFTVDHQELRYAKSLIDRNKSKEAIPVLNEIINKNENNLLTEEAMSLKVRSLLNIKTIPIMEKAEEYFKFKAFYPKSKYLQGIKNLLTLRINKKLKSLKNEIVEGDFQLPHNCVKIVYKKRNNYKHRFSLKEKNWIKYNFIIKEKLLDDIWYIEVSASLGGIKKLSKRIPIPILPQTEVIKRFEIISLKNYAIIGLRGTINSYFTKQGQLVTQELKNLLNQL